MQAAAQTNAPAPPIAPPRPDSDLPPVRFPPKLEALFRPARYKCLKGGRDAGRSWGAARALLVQGGQKPLRILCAREIQSTIADSVHQLLVDQINRVPQFAAFYSYNDTSISGRNGTEIIYCGLRNIDASKIKSFEGIDIAWVEEAESMTKKSFHTLDQTIRKDDSEIWLTWNPQMDSDFVHQYFIEHTPPDAVIVHMTYADNPWASKRLDASREHMRLTDFEEYENIILGKVRTVVAGAIYGKEMRALIDQKRSRPMPYDPALPVHTVWDLGWNDNMSIILVQRVHNAVMVIDYLEDQFKTYAQCVAKLNSLGYNYGTDWLPHDGSHKNPQTGKNPKQALEGLKRRNVRLVPKLPVEHGIKAVRMLFPRLYIDTSDHQDDELLLPVEQRWQHSGPARLIECLKRYKRAVPQSTEEPGAPVHDDVSHGCLAGDSMVRTDRGDLAIRDVRPGDMVLTPCGFDRVTHAGQVAMARELIEVSSAGRMLLCTPEHRIFTRLGLHAADALRYDDAILTGREWQCRMISWFSKACGIPFRRAITGEAGPKAASASCIARCGSRIMDLSRTATRFITRTTTRATTIFATLRKFWSLTTSATTLKKSGLNLILHRGQRESSTRLRGTGQRREGNLHPLSMPPIALLASMMAMIFPRSTLAATGGSSLPSTPSFSANTQHASLLKASSNLQATNAERGQSSGTHPPLDLRGTASREGTHGPAASRSSAFASTAARIFSRLFLIAPSSARTVASIKRVTLPNAIPVYDLTVEHHHCYVANGMLVSNCDALRALATVVDRMTNEDEGAPVPGHTFAPLDRGVGL